MKIKYAFISKTGRRSNNEDFVKIIDKPEAQRWLGVVCDGMGGHALGEVASETVGNVVCEYYEQTSEPDAIKKAEKACYAASSKLNERSLELRGAEMGTTLAMASIEDGHITFTHCGDSRCYFFRDGNLEFQTHDHVGTSFGWEIVTRCFFSHNPKAALPDVTQFEVQPGDRILICSDGLYKSMPPEILRARVMDEKTPEEILDVLDFLCEKHGDDNYTAILAIVE